MIVFLPKLEIHYLLIVGCTELKAVHQPFLPTFLFIFLDGLDNAFAGEFLEIAQYVTYRVSSVHAYNQMQMICHQTGLGSALRARPA